MNYTDIHSHILPGVDDGAQNIQMTDKMLRLAYEQGIRTVVATPHILPSGAYEKGALEQALESARQAVAQISPDMKIYLGGEIYYWSGSLNALQEGIGRTLADSRYTLVEFHPMTGYEEMYQGMKEYIQSGYLPVIAHMERYECLWKKPKRLTELLDLGCYFQMNMSSLHGKTVHSFTRNCRRLVEEGMIHLLATDSHNIEQRPPLMEDIVKECDGKISEDTFRRLLCENPQKIIENQYI